MDQILLSGHLSLVNADIFVKMWLLENLTCNLPYLTRRAYGCCVQYQQPFESKFKREQRGSHQSLLEMTQTQRKKIAAACKYMKQLGFSREQVNPKLKELLVLYLNQWTFIEEENYKVLVDALLLDNDQHDKRIESDKKETGSTSKNKEVKCKEEAPLHCESSASTVRRRGLRPRDLNGLVVTSKLPSMETVLVLGREENVLSSNSSDEESIPLIKRKSVRNQMEKDESDDEDKLSTSEHCEPLTKRVRHTYPDNSKPPFVKKSLVSAREDEIKLPQTFCLEETPEPALYIKSPYEQNEAKFDSPQQSHPHPPLIDSSHMRAELSEEGASSSKKSVTSEYTFFRESINSDRADDVLYLVKQKLESCTDLILAENVADMYQNNIEFNCGELFYNEPQLNEVLLPLMYPDTSNGHNSDVEDEMKFLEYDHLNVDDDVDSISKMTQFDIASSSKGEVKVSLICNPSKTHFVIPSLESVVKVVEEKYERFKIIDPDFSVMKFMENVCECFMAMATQSSADKHLNSFPQTKKSDSQETPGKIYCPNNLDNHQSNSNCSAKIQDLIKIAPSVPKAVALSDLEGLHCISGFKIPDIIDIPCLRKRRMHILKDTKIKHSCGVAGTQKHHISFTEVKYQDDVIHIEDITRGEETMKVSLVHSGSSEDLPTFMYIQKSIVYDKAYVNFTLARISDEECCSHCFGDCLASPIPCECARETGGEFSYTYEGLLKEKFLEECISLNQDPKAHNFFHCKERCPLEISNNKHEINCCKGHLVKKFIKECWSKCGCNKNCGNRVVQRGLTVNLQVFQTPEGKGWGLRTLENLPRGAFVFEHVGEIVTNTELFARMVQTRGNDKHTYPVLLDADWGSEKVLTDEVALCLDATFYGNVARFLNHRCGDATLIDIPVEIETPDHHYHHVAFFTTREVAAMEELTWDYGINFNDQEDPVKAFRCLCGSSLCRDPRQPKRKLKMLSCPMAL
ncbi:hypothetical protein L6164_012968 [Bauhinia variegata]|uniref:Uncharacterized protein n=1 Tax=Bauhinia variegata TaxID=167791 RepID=A0ACB9PBZ7_BAUVA|nr:hypothetical protein L6164_012968 [Bauhinia variegata]